MRKKSLSVTGYQLIRLLDEDGWYAHNYTDLFAVLTKPVGGRSVVAIIPKTRRPLASSELEAIIGPDQASLGSKGLQHLIKEHGLDG
jgi:predicted RNA binding protein YcfA (HicA-like mRNA interferase family)